MASRYALRDPLGSGGAGTVWAARDTLTGQRVAVKLMRPGPLVTPARVRLEVWALRMLRLPGIVELIDEGIDEGEVYLAMELVEGTAFPGRPGVLDWREVEPATLSLLEALAAIHGNGVIHRDLKPENILVDREGRARILDFGLARVGARYDPGVTEEGEIFGTPEYLAPEQLEGRDHPQTDLYAIGVMLHRALTGDFPYRALRPRAMLYDAKLRGLHARLADRRPDLPEAITALCDALLEPDPQKRPGSAVEVIARWRAARATKKLPWRGSQPTLDALRAALGAEGHADLDAEEGTRWTASQLQSVFHGPDLWLHLREDAAALLHRATDGDPRRVPAEIERWVRAGVARWDGPRLRVRREDLLRVEVDPRLTALTAMVTTGRDPLALRDEAHNVAAALAEEGALDRAEHLLAEATRLLRVMGAEASVAEGLFALRARVALAMMSPVALDRALYELCRVTPRSALLGALEQLLRAALAVAHWTDKALTMVEQVPAFESPDLELCRQGVRVSAARKASPKRLAEVLEDLASFPPERRDAAHFALWQGRWFYVEGQYSDAAICFERAARGVRWRTERLNALLNAASSWMEAFDFDAARACAEAARDEASQCRHAFLEARSAWVLRAVAFRLGEATQPDPTLVDAARIVAPETELLMAFTEAAVAFRAGDRGHFVDMAHRVRSAARSSGELLASVLVDAMERSLRLCAAGDADAVLARATGLGVPAITLQVGALLHEAAPFDARARAALEALADDVDARLWSHRMDVLSTEECLARLRAQ